MTDNPPSELRGARYRKSSYSTSTGECLAVGRAGRWVGIQDTKQGTDDSARATLAFSPASFAAFLTAVKSGEL
ncbi:MAG: DUF397 domain-containing protein [Pseudonocardia sp.]|nr:DUF397 domain-containing protein [Pseudonocardia sp.]